MSKSSKGSQFERELCKEVSLWWTGGERNDVFWRSASSGAMATQRAKKGESAFGQHGDITATDPIGQPLMCVFSMELKRGYKEASFWDVMNSKRGRAAKQWEQWFGQTMEGKEASNALTGMLIHKTDRKETLVFFEYSVFKKLRKAHGWAGQKGGITPFFKANIMVPTFRTFVGRRVVIVCMKWQDFLVLDPDCVQEVYEEHCV